MKTILVVEDEPAIAEVLLEILEDAGYHVELTMNGQACLERLDTLRPDLILSDLKMPMLDGRGLCRALRAHPSHASIPFVMMTATIVPLTAEDCPYDGVVTKPFMLHELLGTLTTLMS